MIYDFLTDKVFKSSAKSYKVEEQNLFLALYKA